MTKAIKLHFTNAEHLISLLNDKDFLVTIAYLSPQQIDDNTITLFDPIVEHTFIDTEDVVLSLFATAIKRVIFPKTDYLIEFLNSEHDKEKGGLLHHQNRIIDNTDIQVLPLT